MKTIDMGLNTAPDFVKHDEIVARANGRIDFIKMRERMRDDSLALRDQIIAAVEADGKCGLNWNCTGETLFNILACQWERAMPEYRFEIGRYSCYVYKT